MLSQDDLIDGLRDGLAARAAKVDAPDDLAVSVRRVARRRAGRRAAIAAAPLLVAGGLVAVLTTSGSTRPAPARNAAYVAEQVSDRLAHAGPGSGVRQEIDTTNDPRTPDMEGWTYIDPRSHVEYDVAQFTDPDGRLGPLTWTTLTRHGRRVHTHELSIYSRNRTWSSYDASYTVSGHSTPSSYGGPVQIARALKTGHFSLDGTTTIGGERALKIRLPQMPRRDHVPSGVLYVNAKNYEPIAADTSFRDRRYTYRERFTWLPATHSTIAHAVRRPTVPAGYRKVPYVPPSVISGRQRREYLRAMRQLARRRRAEHPH